MEPERIFLQALEASAVSVGSENFMKQTENMIGLCGAEIVGQINPDDKPRIGLPIELIEDGSSKTRLGAICVLEDRAILGWAVGTFRIKNFTEVIPLEQVQSSEVTVTPGKGLKGREVRVMFEAADRRWTLKVANLGEDVKIEQVAGRLSEALTGTGNS
ncbi:MAG: hypothetical protein U0R24_04050 [Solirubrobacterales bacterium]